MGFELLRFCTHGNAQEQRVRNAKSSKQTTRRKRLNITIGIPWGPRSRSFHRSAYGTGPKDFPVAGKEGHGSLGSISAGFVEQPAIGLISQDLESVAPECRPCDGQRDETLEPGEQVLRGHDGLKACQSGG